jgi:hypothetical protein
MWVDLGHSCVDVVAREPYEQAERRHGEGFFLTEMRLEQARDAAQRVAELARLVAYRREEIVQLRVLEA